MCKQLIGDFAIVKCESYGNYCEIESLEFNAKLKLKLCCREGGNSSEVLVQNGEKTIGVLCMNDSVKSRIVDYLKQDWNDTLYECRVSKVDTNASINERLKATVWINKNNCVQ